MDECTDLIIEPSARPLEPEVEKKLKRELGRCPDLAFAHLPRVMVPGQQDRPEPVLFVWIEPQALRSLKHALNLVSEAVARSLPEKDFLDVVVLNSAPELLDQVERAGCLVVENNPEERARALQAASEPGTVVEEPSGPWWWPF
jgi:hypothetical protein